VLFGYVNVPSMVYESAVTTEEAIEMTQMIWISLIPQNHTPI
jgi:hypothetical protein